MVVHGPSQNGCAPTRHTTINQTRISSWIRALPYSLYVTPLPCGLPWVLAMRAKSKRPKGHDDTLPPLNRTLNTLALARETTGMKSAKEVFTSDASILLFTVIRVVSFHCTLVDCRQGSRWHGGLGNQRSGLCRTGASLCLCLSSPWHGDEKARGGSVQPTHPHGGYNLWSSTRPFRTSETRTLELSAFETW